MSASETTKVIQQIKSWITGRVLFEAEIECAVDAPMGVKLGLAVKVAYKSDAVLGGAVLRDAVLRGAVLSGAVLRDAVLSDAVLRGAVLSGAVLRGAVLRDADLRDAVLGGAVLRDADLSDAVLSGAVLSGAVLRGAVLRDAVLRGAVLSGAVLRGADLRDADLRDAVLSGAVLRDADLSDAVLSGAVLSGAVLRDAVLSDVPLIPNIHQAVYAAASQPNALNMGNWHMCGTTHCRAGWVTALAGDAGKALEDSIGTSAAATLIYLASDPTMDRVPDFYCTNAAALADMKRMADAEAARSGEAI